MEKAIDSTFKQVNIGTIYLHVVLDRPKPHVLRMLSKYSKNRNLTISHLQDRNLSTAMNLGINECKTEFIAVLDGDDEMAEDRLSLQSEFLINHSNVAAVGSDFWQIDELGNKIKYISMPNGKCKEKEFISSPIAHSSAMLRKSFLLQVGAYRGFFQFAEDFDLWLRLSEKYDLANINLPLALYRNHASQTTSHSFQRLAWVQTGARVARTERIAGKAEISDKYSNFAEWKRLNKYSPKIIYLLVFELLLHNINQCIKNQLKIRSRILQITLYLLYPKHFIKKVKNFFKPRSD